MKKLLICLLAGVFLLMASTPAYAGTLRRKIIDDVTLNDETGATTSSVVNVEQSDSIGFFLDYDETEVGSIGTLEAEVTIEISYDGTTWIDGSFFDFAGGPATFVAGENIADDGSYFFWLDPNANVSRVRVVVTAANEDDDDIIVIDCFVVINQ